MLEVLVMEYSNDLNFYDKSEIIDFNLLDKFNTLSNLYLSLKANPKFSRSDVTAKDSKGNECQLELKLRYCNINTYDTIFIEIGKAKFLQSLNCDAFYINFFQNSDIVAIWNMKEIDLTKIKIRYNVKIWDKGEQKYKYEDRYLLPVDEYATIYFWNEKENKYNIITPLIY